MTHEEMLTKIINLAVERGFDIELFKATYKIPPMNNFQLSEFLIMTELYKLLFYDRSFMRCIFVCKKEEGSPLETALVRAQTAVAFEWEHYKGSIEFIFDEIKRGFECNSSESKTE